MLGWINNNEEGGMKKCLGIILAILFVGVGGVQGMMHGAGAGVQSSERNSDAMTYEQAGGDEALDNEILREIILARVGSFQHNHALQLYDSPLAAELRDNDEEFRREMERVRNSQDEDSPSIIAVERPR